MTPKERATPVTNEVEQLLMQNDYDSAKLIISRAIRDAVAEARIRLMDELMAELTYKFDYPDVNAAVDEFAAKQGIDLGEK